jgi:hypothetical protein
LRPLGATLVLAILVASLAASACVPARPTPMPGPTGTPAPTAAPAVPAGWVEYDIGASGVSLALPEGWLALDEADLADPALRAELERDFEGAETLFGSLDAQGRRARIVLLGVDARARGAGFFAPNVTVVAVEPALPPLLLGIGADFAVSALEGAFAIETGIERSDVETPLGGGIRITFGHRVVGPAGGAGVLVEHDGILVTTGSVSFLVSRNVDPGTAPPDTPSIEAVVATLRADR